MPAASDSARYFRSVANPTPKRSSSPPCFISSVNFLAACAVAQKGKILLKGSALVNYYLFGRVGALLRASCVLVLTCLDSVRPNAQIDCDGGDDPPVLALFS